MIDKRTHQLVGTTSFQGLNKYICHCGLTTESLGSISNWSCPLDRIEKSINILTSKINELIERK